MASVAQKWKQFITTLKQGAADIPVRPIILESWKRSRDAGVDAVPEGTLLRRVEADELTARLAANAQLLKFAQPAMERFSRNFATMKHVIYLVDGAGIVLFSTGNSPDMMVQGLMPGFDWSEKTMGTNGAGTALASNQPVAVLGPEHYQLRYHAAACLGAPVHGPKGEVIAALDFSMGVDDARPEHFSAVVQLAGDIERAVSGGVTVLNVDDDDSQRYAVSRLLEISGFMVLEAATGMEALNCAKLLPSVILLDVNLPDMNGFEVCKRLKSDPTTQKIPVLHLSATYTQPADKSKGLQMGAAAYLTHPIEREVLVTAIGGVLRSGSKSL
jgi:transcriptional regulator of acetoin/glycerol metabolism